jgi:flagellar basal-body rod protein FlgB
LPGACRRAAKRHLTDGVVKLARPLLWTGLRNSAREFGSVAGDSLFGVHGAALEVRSQRMGVLASNIANASTPGSKARDIDFKSALASMEAEGAAEGGGAIDGATKYRVPTQTSMDGNTVELSQEQTAFAENAVQYQTTLSFLNGRISQVTRALKGD